MIRQAVLRALEQAQQMAPRAGIVLVAGLAAPLADGAPGDLDPTFGDTGRLVLEQFGPAWSLEMDDDGGGFLAGGDYYYCYWGDCFGYSFTQPFSNAGVPDLEYTHADMSDMLILDAVRQPDGKVVGVGRAVQASTQSSLTVFRLMPDGARDSTFGVDGAVTYTSNASMSHGATSVLLEPDGRIVVAGTRGGALIVLRLLEDGTRDSTFGNDGVVLGAESGNDARLARAPDGGYRITTQSDAFMVGKCRIVALTADGTRDQSFGPGGSVDAAPGVVGSALCHDLAIQPDGRLLVAGTEFDGADSGGLLVRLLPDGTPDDSFAAPAVGQAMSQATALALGTGGDVFVAGQGASDTAGALVARLKADGVLDTTYGNEGTTWIDLPSPWAQNARVYDMAATADGSLTVAGIRGTSPGTAFAARLSGDGSADAAGIVSVTHTRIVASEGEAQAVVTVRRAGGRAGAVSVAYRTAQGGGGGSPDGDASAGSDYQEVSGQLTWDDGDMTDQEVVIPILADGLTPEAPEAFLLEIDSIEGGAAFGGQATRVEIAGDGAPAGQFVIQQGPNSVREGSSMDVWVERMFYGTGEVSVTVTPSGGSTVGQDFDMGPTVLTWADGEQGGKFVSITTYRDSADEGPFEELTLTLSDPTGGAILGARTTSTVQIVDAPSQQSGGGGGGSFGWLSLLGLGAAGLRRFIRAG